MDSEGHEVIAGTERSDRLLLVQNNEGQFSLTLGVSSLQTMKVKLLKIENGNIFLKVVNLFKKILWFFQGSLPIFTGILFYNFYRKIYRLLIEKLCIFLQKT